MDALETPYYLDRLNEKMIGGEPTVKDVCERCNNVVLSRLDTYGVELYRRFFYNIANEGDTVAFDYRFDDLLRWILKLAFNSARINLASDLPFLSKLRGYILGKRIRPKRVALYLSLLFRHELPDEIKGDAVRKGISFSQTHEPDMLRLGQFRLNLPDWNAGISRTAIFQSFLFAVFAIREKEPACELERLKRLFEAGNPHSVLLTPGATKIRVTARVPSHQAFDSHVLINLPYYKRKFPEIFTDDEDDQFHG
jgi:hypothetical protein